MKKIGFLFLIPFLFTACSVDQSKSFHCVQDDGTFLSDITWSAESVKVISEVTYDTEEEAIKEENTVQKTAESSGQTVTRDGKKVTIVTESKNTTEESYKKAMKQFEKDGYTCEFK
ncbi:MAG: hypothetical protein J6X28_04485 [Bacilli bacterium]|nr:hypothetical protein [Bacilli bacterium]